MPDRIPAAFDNRPDYMDCPKCGHRIEIFGIELVDAFREPTGDFLVSVACDRTDCDYRAQVTKGRFGRFWEESDD